MRSKIPLTWCVITLGVTGILYVSLIIFFLMPVLHGQIFQRERSHVSQNFEPTGLELPARLVIPAIHIDATIEHLGLTPQGAMAVPEGPADAAWFDLGPRPGENGSAVIAGHEGWKDGIEAVFDDLSRLQAGDKVYVEDEQGATTTFVVRGMQTYDQNGNAAGVFSSNDGQAHLNLITCEGTWNAAEKSYSNRLVVFADKE